MYRYEREYGKAAEIDIPRLVRLCQKFNWVVDSSEGFLRFTADGKRMILSLFQIANDSLDFHLTPSEMKSLYLARRDIELAGSPVLIELDPRREMEHIITFLLYDFFLLYHTFHLLRESLCGSPKQMVLLIHSNKREICCPWRIIS